MPELTLAGCTPEPLMNYLKALGVLRLVSEQVDGEARGHWRDDVFVLKSKLERDGLIDFFLTRYSPTPIVAPWGARSGFYAGSPEKAARQALETLLTVCHSRFAAFQHVVKRVRELLTEMGIRAKADDESKLALLGSCRAQLPDEIISWLDACYVMLGEERRYPPLLGTGGNEGSGSYVSGLAQQLVSCLVERKHDAALCTALFAISQPSIYTSQTPGHFSGAASGGANGTQGLEASSRTNPWDYVLCLEGTCMWASGVVRRLGQAGPRMASFPFTVNVSGVGSGSLASSDGVKPKNAKRDTAEIWLPLWSRMLTCPELSALLAEGRATVGARSAATGVDMARAMAELGVDRGISCFKRNLFLMRNGQTFLAVPAGTIEVQRRQSVDLIREIDPWLTNLRDACGAKNAPPRFKTAIRGIDQAIFDFCRYGGPRFFQAILVALGQAERELARSEGRVTDKKHCNPLSGLSSAWIEAVNDGTPEFETALALAGIHGQRGKTGPLRTNLEPVVLWHAQDGKQAAKWAARDRAAVWNSASLSVNLYQVLARRIMDGDRKGCEGLPVAAPNFVSLGTISEFLEGELDDHHIEQLLWGLVLVEQKADHVVCSATDASGPPLPRAYALLKLLFLPEPLQVNGQPIIIKPEPQVVTLLRADHTGKACQIAMRRLRASGLAPLPHARSGDTVRDADCLKVDGHRLAAALLLPISRSSVDELCRLVVRKPETQEETP